MYSFLKYHLFILFALSAFSLLAQTNPDSTVKDGPIQLKAPENVEKIVEYDENLQRYVVKEKIGSEDYQPATTKSFEEFWNDKNKEAEKDYWKEKLKEDKQQSDDILQENVVDKSLNSIFGSNFVEIKPQGAAELIFGVTSSKTENPLIRVENQRVTNFDFDSKIQLNVTGIIGQKLKITTNYNTEAAFDFENQMKLEYNGDEDEIIKKIELGNVSMPLNSSLIRGSQSLFGIKSEMQFGKLKVTSILSQQKSQTQSQEVKGGVQKQNIAITADNYDDNRHFYLAQHFYENYDKSMSKLPIIFSQVQITRMEVWITNIGINTSPDARNIIALTDLGEKNTYDPTIIVSNNPADTLPSNNTNDLYGKLADDALVRNFSTASGQLINSYKYTSGINFDKIENAKRLNPNEYTFHPQLGYISLNRRVEDNEVLAVAYEYTVPGDPLPHQVGEFATDVSDIKSTLFLKLLKSTQVNNTKIPLWKLMMKNVYSTGQYGIDQSTLDIDIYYNNPATNNDINFLPAAGTDGKNVRWLELLAMDQLDPQLNRVPDGRYDIIEGLTVRLQNGRIYFPVNEPFGSYMTSKINDAPTAAKYAFDSLYTVPKWKAKNNFPDKNRFKVMVRFESKSSTIKLNAFNIPQGAVTVTAGGRQLTEGVDYRVDYNSAEVVILDQSLVNSNTPIKVDVENNSLFSVTSKTLFGTHLDYEISKDFNVGATVMNLTERPLRNKTNQGSEPISNTVWGLNTSYSSESPLLTKIVDKLPLISTKEKSTIKASGEFAQLIPGSADAIKGEDGKALTYIDDFEAGQINITIKDRMSWFTSSTPQGNPEFKEGDFMDSLIYGYNRAKIAWYNIDPLFSANNSTTPAHIANNARIQDNHYQRVVMQNELFPNRSLQLGEPPALLTFDVAYFPEERGPYNFDTAPSAYSSGVDISTGKLNNPSSRWGGIMRQIRNVDFETQNIEFMEFWVMSPFLNDNGDLNDIGGNPDGGDVYIHLGNISEDILRDGRKNFENGLPSDGGNSSDIDTTNWGRVTNKLNLVTAFDNDPTTRANQDVGLDGLSNSNEQSFYSGYLSYFGGAAPGKIPSDPAADDYHYFRGDDLDAQQANIIERYKNFNGVENNSPTQEQTGLDYISTSTNMPDIEDINRDNTLSEGESYYEYKISMRPDDIQSGDIGTNYLNQVYNTSVTTENGTVKPVTWLQFRIPIRQPDKVIGNIQDFQAIRFMRMVLKGYEGPTVLRFATMDLVQSRWRTYSGTLLDQGEFVPEESATTFNVGSVNLEEDSKKAPVRYVMPPNIQRQLNLATQSQENEQAMQLRVCDLEGGDARAMFKMQEFDLLSYNEILMDVHAEQIDNAPIPLDQMNVSLFIRLGSDFNDNYYEYEVPLEFTDPTLVSSSNDESAKQEVWKSSNLLDFNYKDVFSGLKIERNEKALADPTNVNTLQRYSKAHGKNMSYVKGSPSLEQVKVIMIGVRNNNRFGEKRCVEVWANELRLSGFDKTGGWATTANINMQLADLGNVSLSGGYSTPGWGSIDQKVSDRSREYVKSVDANSSLQLGKFLPESFGLSLPMYMSYNQIRKDPLYNPLDTDVKLEDLDDNSPYKDYLEGIVPDVQTARGINFSNVRKLPKGNKKLMPYSIENWDATYVYNENFLRNVNTEFNTVKNYQGALNYNYGFKSKPFEPFKKSPVISAIEKNRIAKYEKEEEKLKNQISELKKVDPQSAEAKSLEKSLEELRKEKADYKKNIAKIKRSPYLLIPREFKLYYLPKSFSFKNDMSRMYSENKIRNVSDADLLIDTTFIKNWFYTRNYKLDYDLTQNIKFDYTAQHKTFIDEPVGKIDKGWEKDSVWNNVLTPRHMFYTQSSNANWNVPINKFPWTSWINTSLKYTGKYDWQAAPLSMKSLGNNISNSNNKQITTQFNLLNLYNKVGYLKDINSKKPKKVETAATDSTKQEKKPKFEISGKDILDGTLRGIMMLRNINITYSENNGTFIPGYMDDTQFLGLSNGDKPGWGFVFGSQQDILAKGIREGWFSSAFDSINQRVSNSSKDNLSIRASVEPFEKFRIDLEGQRSYGANRTYFYNIEDNELVKFSPQNTYNYSISINSISTAFNSVNAEGFSETFLQMEKNRITIANRLHNENPNITEADAISTTEFPNYYDGKQDEVLLYSFLAAYTGKNPNKQELNAIKNIPIPNWGLNYDGLLQIPLIKRYFSAFTISHRYKSTFNFNGYQNNLNFVPGQMNLDDELNMIPEKQFQNADVSIQEQFGPLGKIDMRLKNSILASFELRKSRTVGLNFGRSTVTEQNSFDIVVGGGYVIKDLVLPIRIQGKKLKSNLDVKANVAVKSSSLTLMEIDGAATTTQGSRMTNINLTADYQLSKQLTVRAFYTQTLNNPFIATSYPTSTSSGGLSLRFTL